MDTEQIAALLLRVTIGGVFLAHGLQKVFGLWGGAGPRGWWNSLARRGLRPVAFWWTMSVGAELGAAALLLVGLLTPLAAAALVGHVVVILNEKSRHGFFNSHDGVEFPLTLGLGALTIGLLGPGSWSLDAALGIVIPGVLVALVFVLSLVVAIVAIAMERRQRGDAVTA
jgi:putative oxidoreductase